MDMAGPESIRQKPTAADSKLNIISWINSLVTDVAVPETTAQCLDRSQLLPIQNEILLVG